MCTSSNNFYFVYVSGGTASLKDINHKKSMKMTNIE